MERFGSGRRTSGNGIKKKLEVVVRDLSFLAEI